MAEEKEIIIIIGIGHSSEDEGGESQLLVNPSIIALGIANSSYNALVNKVIEYRYCKSLANLVKENLSKLTVKDPNDPSKTLKIKAYTANQYKGADINGGSKGSYDINAEVAAINGALPKYNNQVKVAINLCLNNIQSSTASGHTILVADSKEGKQLGELIKKKLDSCLGSKGSSVQLGTASNSNIKGMEFPKGVRVPAALIKLFCLSNNSDLKKGLEKEKDIALALANTLKEYCEKQFLPYVDPNNLDQTKCMSSSLVADKIKPTLTDDEQITNAVDTQAKLTDIEREMGEGGNIITSTFLNSIEIIGGKPLPLSPVRIDDNGNVLKNLVLRPGGVVENQSTYPYFEPVDYTADLPFGSKKILASNDVEINGFELNLGAVGQINMINGGITTIMSDKQVNLTSAYNINLLSGKVANIKSDNICLEGQTSVTGNLNNFGNIVTNGQVYAEGGISSPTFNGAAQIDKTNDAELYGYISSNSLKLKIKGGKITLKKPIEAGATELEIESIEIDNIDSGKGEGGSAIVTIPPHKHYFYRLAGALEKDITAVQSSIASTINN